MKKTNQKMLQMVLLLSLLVLALSVSVQGAGKKYKNQWRTVSGKTYYYDARGKKVTGLYKIGKKNYFFDKKGVQRTGWRYVRSRYYYFIKKQGKSGYALRSHVVNGISLDKNGVASKKGRNLRKLKIMVKVNELVDVITRPSMTKRQKLRACFDYTMDEYPYYIWRDFENKPGWELTFAEDMLDRGKGDCISYSSVFAFMANAIGYKDVNMVCSGIHGWAEINGKIYDPNFAMNSKADSFFGMPYSLSGVNNRPHYAPTRFYVVKI